MEDCGLCLGKIASFSHRLERKLEITVPPPPTPRDWVYFQSCFSWGRDGGGEAEGRRRSGPACSSHLALGIPENSIQSRFPKGVSLGSEQ